MTKKSNNLIKPLFNDFDNSKYLNNLKSRSYNAHVDGNSFDLLNLEIMEAKGVVALWKAVVMQAAVDLQSKSKKRISQTYRVKALMWFNLNNQEFLQVCNWADLDSQYVIERVNSMKEEAINFMVNNPMLIS